MFWCVLGALELIPCTVARNINACEWFELGDLSQLNINVPVGFGVDGTVGLNPAGQWVGDRVLLRESKDPVH